MRISSFVESNQLLKHTPSYRSVIEGDDPRKLVVPKKKRAILLEEYHNSATAGHLGVRKTFQRVAQKLYWSKMKVDIESYVRK